MAIERAISIRQPLAEMILRGLKREEYRSRPTKIRERVYVYASLQPVRVSSQWKKVRLKPGDLPVGVIVGSVEIVDCRKTQSGAFAYVLHKPIRLRRARVPVNQPQPVFWRPEF